MKKLILLLFPLILLGQENTQIEFHQDTRMAFVKDNHGNEPFTLDFRISLEMQGKQLRHSYFAIKPQFWYADLYGGKFVSWNVNIGYVYNKLLLKNFEVGVYGTFGLLHRFNSSWASYGATFELSYKINDKFKIGAMSQNMTRPDISEGIKTNTSLGLKYVLL